MKSRKTIKIRGIDWSVGGVIREKRKERESILYHVYCLGTSREKGGG